jgi:hypothetical protein
MPNTEEKRKERPKQSAKRKKNESLQLLRNVAKSMAGAVPFVSDETREVVEDSLARPLSGLASQYMGYNEETGGVENAAIANLKRIWNADSRRKQGLPPEKRVIPGMVADALSLPNILGNGPEWSARMQELADATHSGVDEGLGLAPPQGFRQHALDSLGVTLGQVPVPGRQGVDAAKQTAEGALALMKRMGKGVLTSPVEFLSPTIQPKASNYLFGAVGGGALGSLGDEVPLDEEVLDQPRLHRAEGGKVGALQAFLRSISLNPDARVRQTAHQMGDPVEEVLYATNEGQRKGVLSTVEAQRIKELLTRGEEEKLSEALMELHARLHPKAEPHPVLQNSPKPHVAPPSRDYREPVHAHGTMPADEFDRRFNNTRKARGGRISRR